MTFRFVKGKLRVESPRLKDLSVATSAGERSVDHGADGRFVSHNGAANGREAKTLIRQSLGADDADPELVRQALTMYRAILRASPTDGPSVRQLIASRCRHAVMATRFANEAAKAGLATPIGLKLAEASRAHDLAAQRLAVTAFDLASRESASRLRTPIDPLAREMAAIEAEAEAADALEATTTVETDSTPLQEEPHEQAE